MSGREQQRQAACRGFARGEFEKEQQAERRQDGEDANQRRDGIDHEDPIPEG